MGSKNSTFFADLEINENSKLLVQNIETAFCKAMEIDFEDILVNNRRLDVSKRRSRK